MDSDVQKNEMRPLESRSLTANCECCNVGSCPRYPTHAQTDYLPQEAFTQHIGPPSWWRRPETEPQPEKPWPTCVRPIGIRCTSSFVVRAPAITRRRISPRS